MEWNPKNGPENPDIDHFIIFKKLIAVFFNFYNFPCLYSNVLLSWYVLEKKLNFVKKKNKKPKHIAKEGHTVAQWLLLLPYCNKFTGSSLSPIILSNVNENVNNSFLNHCFIARFQMVLHTVKYMENYSRHKPHLSAPMLQWQM